LFLLSLAIVSLVQLHYVNVEMKRSLADQQHMFVSQIAKELDHNLSSNLKALAATANAMPAQIAQDPQKLETWLGERVALRSLFPQLFIVSPDGEVLADMPPRGRRGFNVSAQETFRQTVATRKPQISTPFMARSLKQPIVSMTAPVFDGQGRIVALVSAGLPLLQPNFLGDLANARVGKTGSFELFTRDRMIVISREKDRIMAQGPPAGVSPYFDRATSGMEGSEEAVNRRGLHAIFSYSQLDTVPWVLVASLPIDEAYALVRTTQRKILLVTLLLALLVAPLIWYAVRRWFDPLQAALWEREAGLRRAQLMAKLAHIVTGPDGRFESWSDTLPELTGVAPGQMPRSTRDWLGKLHPADRERFRQTSIDAALKGSRADIEYRMRRPDERWIYVRQAIEPLESHDADGDGQQRWFSTLQDITEQKQSEEKIERLNRVYAVLSGINAVIVRAQDRGELFSEACRIAVKEGKLPLAWIGIMDQAHTRFDIVASAGDSGGYLDGMAAAVDQNVAQGRGMVAEAIRDAKATVSNDVTSDPRVLIKQEALARGFRSLVVLPLIVAGKVIGVLTLYAEQVGFFDDQEMKLLLELAGDISFALDHLEKVQKLDYLAYYDQLTGLANRTLFLERVAQQLIAAGSSKGKVAVFTLDVERFRTINDALGRRAGDDLLRQIADRFRKAAGDESGMARIGADHFAVVSAEAQNEEQLARLTELRLEECFGSPFRIGDGEVRASAKVGIAVFPNDGADADTLLRNAEAALKKAKARGERYLFYTQEMTERIAEKLALESKLRQALEKEEFVLHYQPKVDLETRSIVGVEALIRWQSPELGLVPPLQFIPLLEETGLILQVGSWALKRASLEHRGWVERGLKPPRVAVNVSPIQLRQRNFVQSIEQAIMDGLAPTAIDLEITESLIMEDIQGNIEKLNAVRALGVNIAIDDFGTGYSSLGYLARLPVQALKIDRSFINAMNKDSNAMTLVSTIISLAHSLQLKVIAEGVETEEQAKYLRLLRCDEMQGYLFSKPLPLDALVALLRETSRS
jgi:diguanylate cyclase (GGDEF)-like protein